jgi:hypothetical protein
MEDHAPRIGEFVSTHSRGLVDIAHVDPELVYLQDTPNRPIQIANLMPSPDRRHGVWVIVHEAVAAKFRPGLDSTTF